MRPDLIRGHLDGLLLSILSEEPAHGYGLVERLTELSGGAFALPEGTVYPALHRLERDGLVASRWLAGSGRRRRVYRLTARGRRASESARAEWRSFADAMARVLGTTA